MIRKLKFRLGGLIFWFEALNYDSEPYKLSSHSESWYTFGSLLNVCSISTNNFNSCSQQIILTTDLNRSDNLN